VRRFVVLGVLAVLGLPAGASAATLGEQRVLLILTTWGPERGSGVAAHEVFVDGRRASRVPAVRTVANLLVSTDDSVAVRVGRGRHRLRVFAVDRAGNRADPPGGSSTPSPGRGEQPEPKLRAVPGPPTRAAH
jgi:hypothetical protein